MAVYVKSYAKKSGSRVRAHQRRGMSRLQRLSSIEDRLSRRKSNSGMRGILIIENRLRKIRRASKAAFDSPAEVARRRATKLTLHLDSGRVTKIT